ncbi:MAG: hypothetical protein E7653_02105 [Ruminococcaceae bacterium]|nr:hypothetical protein [Oscillospiraceae bacterium]
MKKLVCLLLVIVLFVSLLAGCNTQSNGDNNGEQNNGNENQLDDNGGAVQSKWDGTVAASFESGSGTEADPYKIATPSQLAYLAKQVNEGNSYEGSYFELTSNIDLNNISWTPIGDGTRAFKANFDGKGHTVLNLKITEVFSYFESYGDVSFNYGLTGLFAFCENAIIKNMNIDTAVVVLENNKKYDGLYIGVLAGRLEVTSKSEISNIRILDSSISLATSDTLSNVGTSGLCAGGLVGFVSVSENSQSVFDRVESNIAIITKDVYIKTNINGGIIGLLNNYSIFECDRFASYLMIRWSDYQVSNYAAAFGTITNDPSAITKLSDGFSENSINKSLEPYYGYNFYNASAIICDARQVKNPDGTISGSFEFENLFGCVKPIDETAGFTEPICQLYNMPSNAVYTENNCQACDTLPQNHGFDESVWDLSNLSAPKLK